MNSCHNGCQPVLAASMRESKCAIIPDEKGIYKWWAAEEELEKIKKVLGIQCQTINSKMEHIKVDGKEIYCIYVGKADGSLQKRIRTHLRGNVNKSTLSKSIAAILDTDDRQRIRGFLDNLYVCWREISSSSEHLSQIEKKIINKFIRILNIKENDSVCKEIKEKLSNLRKNVN